MNLRNTMSRTPLAVLAVLLLISASLQAQSGIEPREIDRAGQSGWQFLKINGDARQAAMGGIFLVSSQANANADIDGEGLINSAEYTIGTNPHVTDTDGDGIDDWWEDEYADYFDIAEQDALDPTVYDAYDKVVQQIPARWWYTWWMYCDESSNPKIDYFEPTNRCQESSSAWD